MDSKATGSVQSLTLILNHGGGLGGSMQISLWQASAASSVKWVYGRPTSLGCHGDKTSSSMCLPM